ncbi:helix-turn-helix domain-containing protein [Nocardia salmonicida]|uniref:helix-turn-helix domain-containing protein n=1 Tax=Nocardia salmonicida TaxID=53431 RepID=UPI0007A4269C|nr:helix-turn-helix transcriptional regulator [Nocardia salmonicida]
MNQAINLAQLVGVLNARITAEGISWRQAAAQIGVSPALLSRLRNGLQPDLQSYAKIVRWLNMSADEFLVDPATSVRDEGEPKELNSEVSALLRARADLDEDAKTLLEEVFRSTLAHVRAARPEM